MPQLFFGFFDELRLFHGADGGQGHDLSGPEHALEADAGAGERGVLPGVEYVAQTAGGHVEHDGGGGVAHIAHVGGTGAVGRLQGIEGVDDGIQGFQHGQLQLIGEEVGTELLLNAL